jgi:ABC-2 type transport system ATP-binding protein
VELLLNNNQPEFAQKEQNGLVARQLSHNYGNYQALSETDLYLQPGEVVVLSGPNGAGKTTLLLCLSGLLYPSSGRVWIDGHDLYGDEVEAKSRLAFVPDVPRFYTELTAWEHLRFVALANHAGEGFEVRAEGLMKEFGLWEARDLLPHHYSRGMRLKLGLVMAFIRPFNVLLLDEPTSALDTEGLELIQSKIRRYRQDGAAILLSSHDRLLSSQLADRVLNMRAGKIYTNDRQVTGRQVPGQQLDSASEQEDG